MLSPQQLYGWLEDNGVRFFAGVPDSLLKDFCAYVNDHAPAERHVITANEGGAIALAMGRHLATSEVPVVYMQNSGLGNTVNPITSLAAPDVYGIPMLLVVGWRGEPGKKDEPQHVHMGRVTRDTLGAIGVPHVVLPADAEEAKAAVAEAIQRARRESTPVALVVKKGTFESYKPTNLVSDRYAMTRERAIEAFVDALPDDAAVVSTTGKPSRELFEVRAARKQPHRDFLTVGGMGHASQIALGAALAHAQRPMYCLDGDGAVLMHMGGLSTIGSLAPKNFKHVVVNNAAHDSVGGQPTVGFDVDLCAVAMACGYRHAVSVSEIDALEAALTKLRDEPGPAMVEVRVCKGARSDLGRPTMTPRDLKRAIMADLAR